RPRRRARIRCRPRRRLAGSATKATSRGTGSWCSLLLLILVQGRARRPQPEPIPTMSDAASASCDSPVYPVDPFTFVLHGASGDLARRKILPALAHLADGGYFPQDCRIILSQRQAVSPEEALAQQDAFLREIGDEAACRALPALKPLLATVAVDISGGAQAREQIEAAIAGAPRPVIHYAALPASRYMDLMGLIKGPRDPAELRVVLEKPLGRSGEDSRR